jgi:hypothetical protein
LQRYPFIVVGIIFGAGAAFAATWQKTTDGSSVISTPPISTNNTGAVDTELAENFIHYWSENLVVKFRSCEVINDWPNDCSTYEDAARS